MLTTDESRGRCDRAIQTKLRAAFILLAIMCFGCAPADRDQVEEVSEVSLALDTASVGAYSVFNDPTVSDPSSLSDVTTAAYSTIHRHIIALIDKTPRGAWIRVGMYSFNRKDVKNALIRAVCRGVVVRMVVDQHGQEPHEPCVWSANPGDTSCTNYTTLAAGYATTASDGVKEYGLEYYLDPNRTLSPSTCAHFLGDKTLGRTFPAPTVATTCTDCSFTRCGQGAAGHACISSAAGGVQHEKYFLFSTTYHPTSGEKLWRTVLASSANMTGGAGEKQWNNAVVTYGDDAWYDAWVGHFNDQKSEVKSDYYYSPSNDSGYYQSSLTGYTAFFSPVESGGRDVFADRLTPATAALPHQPRCLLWINQSHIQERPAVVSEAIRLKVVENCDVRVLWNRAEDNPYDALRLSQAGIPMVQVDIDNDGNGKVENITHNKYILFSGTYGGEPSKTRVWTGSHNLLRSALYDNDEVIVKIGTSSVFREYQMHFCKMWKFYTKSQYMLPQCWADLAP